MTNFDFRKVAISSLGAIAFSATCVLAAVGPVRANAPLTSDAWAATVQGRIDGADRAAMAVRPGKVAEARVAVRFAASGTFADAALAESSGNPIVDAQALRIARTLNYPALPAGYRGREQQVTLRLAFGGQDDLSRHFAATRGRVEVAKAQPVGFAVAAR